MNIIKYIKNNMINKKIDELYFILKFGIPKKKYTKYELRKDNYKYLRKPIFFLSTGRCGTSWFNNFLNKDKDIKAFHSPLPDLTIQSKVAYTLFKKNEMKINSSLERVLSEIFLVARDEYLRYSYKTKKRYVETNNHVTFFAPLINKIIPDVKFVHLYRHPGDFVRSAMRRKYYHPSKDSQITKRIEPTVGSREYTAWKSLTPFEKSCWLWKETNMFIEEFKSKIPQNRVLEFNLNNLSENSLVNLCKKLNINISKKWIHKLMNTKINKQKSGYYRPYKKWSLNKKNELRNICGQIAIKYGYNI